MCTIGDCARHGRVSGRMLRHYDATGLLRPARVDPATGYRSQPGVPGEPRRLGDGTPGPRDPGLTDDNGRVSGTAAHGHSVERGTSRLGLRPESRRWWNRPRDPAEA